MIYTYDECLDKYGSDYLIKKALKENKLYKIEKGIYSENKNVSVLEILTKRYPKAILTMNTAFYYHGLTDVIPELYYLATVSSSKKLVDKRIKQIYVPEDLIDIGKEEGNNNGVKYNIYSKERMLIELLRFKNILPYDYYKEILNNYREIIYELNISGIEKYAKQFPKSKMILEALRKEVL